ncbi:hypothetical protein QTP88_013692 [Uroleucon formosanum]
MRRRRRTAADDDTVYDGRRGPRERENDRVSVMNNETGTNVMTVYKFSLFNRHQIINQYETALSE